MLIFGYFWLVTWPFLFGVLSADLLFQAADPFVGGWNHSFKAHFGRAFADLHRSSQICQRWKVPNLRDVIGAKSRFFSRLSR